MSHEPLTVTFDVRRLSQSGHEYVIIPREYHLVAELSDGTTLFQWSPMDIVDSNYAEQKYDGDTPLNPVLRSLGKGES